MAAFEHLTPEIIERYETKNASTAEFLAVNSHISDCADCCRKLEGAAKSEAGFADLHNQFNEIFDEEFTHLPYEQLAFYADGNLDDVKKEIADSHLAVCQSCTKDLADLRGFQTIAAALPIVSAHETAALPSRQIEDEQPLWWRKLFASDFLAGGNFLAPAGVGFAVILMLLLGVWFAARRDANNQIAEVKPTPQITITPSPSVAATLDSNFNSNENQTIANQNPNTQTNTNSQTVPRTLPSEEMLVALSDGGVQIGVDADGNLSNSENLPASVRDAVRRSIKNQRAPLPRSLDAIASGQTGILMGGSAGATNNGVPFALVSPIGKVVRESQPVLRWKNLTDAKSYTVAVVDSSFRVVAQSPQIAATEWKVDKSLPRGANYSWQVTAVKADGSETVSPTAPAPQAKFRVMEQTALDDLTVMEKSGTKSHLARGIIYAQAGLKEEARAEFHALLKENPRSTLARRLLDSVK